LDLETIYEWAKKNKMKFNEKKFEQMTHGNVKKLTTEPYKTVNGHKIQIKETVKDLGISATNDLKFKEHIGEITTHAKIMIGTLLRSFGIREIKPMIKLFNSYIKNKLDWIIIKDYLNLNYIAWKEEEIDIW